MPSPNASPSLARTMGLWALVIYGVGDMLGSGIYALIGKVAGTMGNAAWLAFLASLLAALLTALSYASLGSRYPRAAGAAYITHRAFHQPFLSYLVGLAVIASGLTSMATQSHAFAGYLRGLLPFAFPHLDLCIILAFLLVLTFINLWGMRESAAFNALCTFIEVSGLLLVIAVGLRFWGRVNYLEVPPDSPDQPGSLSIPLILQGAVLAFYAFVGFEDMINVSEEVKNPRRNFPIAVILAISITALIYVAVAITAVSVLPHTLLARSPQPLVDVVRAAAPWFPTRLFSLIALFAIANTALLNYIMGSRLVYGMARQGFIPRPLADIHPRRRTPHRAILTLLAIVLILAFSGDIRLLATATSALLLCVFILINASLILLRHRPDEPRGALEIPRIIPLGGILTCAALLTHANPRALLLSLLLLLAISLLYLLSRPKPLTDPSLATPDED